MAERRKWHHLNQKKLDAIKVLSEAGLSTGEICRLMNIASSTLSYIRRNNFDYVAYKEFLKQRHSKQNSIKTSIEKNTTEPEMTYNHIGGLLAEINKNIARLVEIMEQERTVKKMERKGFFNIR